VRADQIEMERRIGLLERAIAERGWSLQLANALGREFGCEPRTIRKYHRTLVERYVRELRGQDLDEARAEFLGRLRGHQRSALAAGKFSSLAAMLGMESRILGLERPVAVQVQVEHRAPLAELSDERIRQILDDLKPSYVGRGYPGQERAIEARKAAELKALSPPPGSNGSNGSGRSNGSGNGSAGTLLIPDEEEPSS
jgi:hypothetical protein